MNLSKDNSLRIKLSSKKISKGYNGYVILLIKLIYDSQNIPSEIRNNIDSNTEWCNFIHEFYEPYLEKFSLVLGGYHPRTKKEANLTVNPEEEELTFFYEQEVKPLGGALVLNDKPQGFKFPEWAMGNSFGKNFSDFEEIYNEYDDYYNDRKYQENQENEATKEKEAHSIERQKVEENNSSNEKEDKMQIEENGYQHHVYNSSQFKVRAGYEDYYYFD